MFKGIRKNLGAVDKKRFLRAVGLGIILSLVTATVVWFYVLYGAPFIFSWPLVDLVCGAVPSSLAFNYTYLILYEVGLILSGFAAGFMLKSMKLGLVAGLIVGVITYLFILNNVGIILINCPAEAAGYSEPLLNVLFSLPFGVAVVQALSGLVGGFVASREGKASKLNKKRNN